MVFMVCWRTTQGLRRLWDMEDQDVKISHLGNVRVVSQFLQALVMNCVTGCAIYWWVDAL